MRRRYKWLRNVVGVDFLTAGIIAFINEFSNLPPHKVEFMQIIWDMDTNESNV